jgi:hypothetical protein
MSEAMNGRDKRGGWFKVEHAALQLIEDSVAPRQRPYVLAAYTMLLRLANENRRSSVFEASNRQIAEMAGMSKDTFERVMPELVALGLVVREKGTRGDANRWTVAAESGWGSRRERPSEPLGAAGVAATSGSTRARPLHGEEEKKNRQGRVSPGLDDALRDQPQERGDEDESEDDFFARFDLPGAIYTMRASLPSVSRTWTRTEAVDWLIDWTVRDDDLDRAFDLLLTDLERALGLQAPSPEPSPAATG